MSEKIRTIILNSDDKRVLLIHSGTSKRYWLYINDISYRTPDMHTIPQYYRNLSKSIKTWFKVIKITKADKDIMSKCIVSSSGNPLSEVSKHSMSPYFIIEYDEGA